MCRSSTAAAFASRGSRSAGACSRWSGRRSRRPPQRPSPSGAPPYSPYVEILEPAARMFPPETMRETLGDSAPEVAKLMPELRRLFPDIPSSPALPSEQERPFLSSALRACSARTGRTQPAVYVLDDLHWADDSALLLLQPIAQQLHEMPVLIVGTYRDVELDVPRPFAQTLEELLRQRLAHRIAIKRLPQ